jgi:protein SCO1
LRCFFSTLEFCGPNLALGNVTSLALVPSWETFAPLAGLIGRHRLRGFLFPGKEGKIRRFVSFFSVGFGSDCRLNRRDVVSPRISGVRLYGFGCNTLPRLFFRSLLGRGSTLTMDCNQQKKMPRFQAKSSIPSNSFRGKMRLLIVPITLALAFAVAYFLVGRSSDQPSSETFYGEAEEPSTAVYDFHLVDQNGRPFTLSQLHGKSVLFSFGYTHCPDVCPTTLTDFTNIYRALPEKDRTRVQVLFISIDPERDHPDTLKEYISYFEPSFVGLTGTSDQIKQAATSFGAAYTTIRPPGEKSNVYFVNHSSFAYLIGPDGKFQLRYLYEQLRNTDKVTADIKRLLADP